MKQQSFFGQLMSFILPNTSFLKKSILLLLFHFSAVVFAQGGLDSSFNPADTGFGNGDGLSSQVTASAIQSGKVIIIGSFKTYNGMVANGIARVNTDGTIDTTFNPGGTGPNSSINAIAVQPDGKIIIGGQFTTYNSTTTNRIARLNADGTLDTTFNTVGAGLTDTNDNVTAIAVQTVDDTIRIIIGGHFASYNGTPSNNIARLDKDGIFDNSFAVGTGTNDVVSAICIQPQDNSIIIGGMFSTYNGLPINRVAHLATNGTLDQDFNKTGGVAGVGPNGQINAIVIQGDKIIIGGTFTKFNNISNTRIVRLDSKGIPDATFTAGTGTDNSVYTIALQSDGKIIIGGSFSSYNGAPAANIARLDANGILETNFNTGTGVGTYNQIYTIAFQSDGKIIIGGNFFKFNGLSAKHIARLNQTGSLDSSFNSGTGANDAVSGITVQGDKILISGGFMKYNGTVANGIARLSADGSLDNSFITGTGVNGGIIYAIAAQSDKILIGGYFTAYNGITRSCIARLNTDGSSDPIFNSGAGTDGWITAIAVQPVSKQILIGGLFSTYNGKPTNGIARLNEDGSLDETFKGYLDLRGNPTISAIAVQSEGQVIIGGSFAKYGDTAKMNLARLKTDGTLDDTFNKTGEIVGSGPNLPVNALAIQSDGKILIAGRFTTYNGAPISNGIARLNADGTPDLEFNAAAATAGVSGTKFSVNTINILSDGSIIIAGNFTSYNGSPNNGIAHLKADGTLDTEFNIGTGINTGAVTAVAVQSDGNILIGGTFTSYNGTGRNRIARIQGKASSDLGIKQFDKTTLSFYPNPVTDELSVSNDTEIKSIEVFNLQGQHIRTVTPNAVDAKVNMSDLSIGTYLLQITSQGKPTTIKVVKK